MSIAHRDIGSEPTAADVPRWLHLVLTSDRAGSSWYIGLGFFFAPALTVVSPWPTLTVALWTVIALAGLWLGLLGAAMATGLALMMRADVEIPDRYWQSLLNYPTRPTPTAAPLSN